ncbi:MAG: deoxyribonuclease IV [Euryarchaeota archaeon]|nr:deoxyribonuclease IV [Euryarchaeota archaeon]
MLLGAHVSVAGGLDRAPGNGASIGCEAIQIFSKNQRQWKTRPLGDAEAGKFREGVRERDIREVVIHDSYLINLADPNEEGVRRSREAFVDEMRRADALGVGYLIFHPGAPKEAGEAYGLKRIAESLDWCLAKADETKAMLLLENTAGQGSNVGWRFEHIHDIMEGVSDRKRLGVCVDTCHTFAAGYDIRTREGYEATVRQIERHIGLGNIRAFHLNDSKKDLNCRVDRHEHIGEGKIGLELFRWLVNDPRFENVPAVLETPGEEEDFRRNLKVLKGLRKK